MKVPQVRRFDGFANPDYAFGMSRTDRRGRGLKQFLQAEILGRDLTAEELRTACGLSVARYYGDRSRGRSGRAEAEDFPNTEELRLISDHYELGDDGYLNLLVEFGWLEPRADAPGYSRPPVVTEAKKAVQKRKRLRDSKVNPDASPLH